jgi:VanZ family protein
MKKTAALFFLFIVVIVILADTGNLPHPVNAIYRIPYGDKFGHFILFGLLNFFVTRAALSSLSSHRPIRVALSVGLTLALLIALEEWSQKLFPVRTFELLDLFASCLGAAVGGVVAWKFAPSSS